MEIEQANFEFRSYLPKPPALCQCVLPFLLLGVSSLLHGQYLARPWDGNAFLTSSDVILKLEGLHFGGRLG